MVIAPPEDTEDGGRGLRVRSSRSWVTKLRVKPTSLTPSLGGGPSLLARLALDKALQAVERLVPLCRNRLEMPACGRETPLFQLPDALATVRRAAHEAGVFHDAQVLGNRLT